MRPYYQKVSYRVLKTLFRSIRVKLPGRELIVPCRRSGALAGLHWAPSWKTDLFRRVQAVRPGALIDIGANVGQTLFDHVAAGGTGRYVGFEPNIRCVSYLRELIELNALATATVVPVALGATTGVVALRTAPNNDADSTAFIDPSMRPGWTTREELVACVRFDDAFPSLGLDRISLCKIDVEGYELEVVRGMRQTLEAFRPPFCCEVLDADPDADMERHATRVQQLEALLADLGYEIYRIQKRGEALSGCAGIDQFPRRRWQPATAEDCDYLFVHRSDSLIADMGRLAESTMNAARRP